MSVNRERDGNQPQYDMESLEAHYLNDGREYYNTSSYNFPITAETHADILSCDSETPAIYIPRHRDTEQFRRILEAAHITRNFGSERIGEYFGKQPWMNLEIEAVSGLESGSQVFRLHGKVSSSQHIAELYDIYATVRAELASKHGDQGRVRFVIEADKKLAQGMHGKPEYWLAIKAEIVEDC
jgi:hypothetical protein